MADLGAEHLDQPAQEGVPPAVTTQTWIVAEGAHRHDVVADPFYEFGQQAKCPARVAISDRILEAAELTGDPFCTTRHEGKLCISGMGNALERVELGKRPPVLIGRQTSPRSTRPLSKDGLTLPSHEPRLRYQRHTTECIKFDTLKCNGLDSATEVQSSFA
jgi:hypothetical protein